MRNISLLATVAIAGIPLMGVASETAATINKQKVSVEKPKLAAEQALRLKRIFLFPSVDDISGVLAPNLDEKLAQIFRTNTRFDLVRDQAVMKALSPDESAYAKVAQNQIVHREAAKATGADTTVLLHTKNVGPNTEMSLELRDADGELLYVETGSIPGYSPMDARWALVEKLFNAVLKRIPFEGTVTGRTAGTITVDLGAKKLKMRDELELARIVSVQRHPLLKTVVGTDYVRVGRAKVTNVDKVLAFAEIQEEFPGEFVSAGNKIIAVRRASEEAPVPAVPRSEPESAKAQKDYPKFEDERLAGEFDRPKARYGQVGLQAAYGHLSNSQTVSGASTEISGSGIGVEIEGELWITRNWILSGAYGSQSASLKGQGVTMGVDSSWKRAQALVGYRFFPVGIGEGMSVTGLLGYQSIVFDIPATGNIGGRQHSGLALRADAEVLLVNRHKFGTGISFQPFSSVTEKSSGFGAPDGGSVVAFHLNWSYALVDTIWFRLGLEYEAANSNYLGNASAAERKFMLGPALFYAF